MSLMISWNSYTSSRLPTFGLLLCTLFRSLSILFCFCLMQLNIMLIDAGIHFVKDHNNQDIIIYYGCFLCALHCYKYFIYVCAF